MVQAHPSKARKKCAMSPRAVFGFIVVLQCVVVFLLYSAKPELSSSKAELSPNKAIQSATENTMEKAQALIEHFEELHRANKTRYKAARTTLAVNSPTLQQESTTQQPPAAGGYQLHHHDFHLDGKIDTKETWEHLENLPQWTKDYFSWHARALKKLHTRNWSQFNYLVLTCMLENAHCGGTSDRLKPLPIILYEAHVHQRLFFIQWTRPYPLEEFLIPNALNWTVPSFLVAPFTDDRQNGRQVTMSGGLKRFSAKMDMKIVRVRMQTFEGGADAYQEATNMTYDEIYHDLFRLLFEPSPPIAAILRNEMAAAKLIPGEYAVAHYRAFYARADRDPHVIRHFAQNAVDCASLLKPGGPIYFASDSLAAIAYVKQYASRNSYRIVTIENQEPLHLDKAGNWSTRSPQDFYSIFVDLYLMGMGRCISFGQGGFGRYGLLLSYNYSCSNRHTYHGRIKNCTSNWGQVD